MKKVSSIILCSFGLLLSLANLANAKEWRGIVPLQSNRSDVQRLLGKPALEGRNIEGFDIDGVRVLVMYVRKRCEQGLPGDWGNWNVPANTVLNVYVPFPREVRPADLKALDLEALKSETDHSGATYYHDRKEGLDYHVNRLGFLEATVYGPAEEDAKLLCKKKAQ